MRNPNKYVINLILLVFILLDLVYAVICFFFPDFWYHTFHGTEYIDPQGLLQRTAAIWATFTLFQLLALLKWQKQPYWLAIIAGMRLSEFIADWAYLYFAEDITALGRLGLLVSSPANFLICLYLLRSYLELQGPRHQFFSRREFRTLVKFAEVAIQGQHQLFADSAAQPPTPLEVAHNIDNHIARINSKRKRGIKMILFFVEYLLPLSALRPPFSMMTKKGRRRFIERKFINPSRLNPFRFLLLDLARIKTLFLTGYYGDQRVFDCINFKPVEGRKHYRKDIFTERPVTTVVTYTPPGNKVKTEVCVIGSGAGGAVVAYHAARLGYDVVLIEEGPYLSGEEEISHDDGEMTAKLYKEGGLQTTVDLHLGIQQGKCLGGSTFINNAICLRLGDPQLTPPGGADVFERWKELGAHINVEKLNESYDRVESMIKVRPAPETKEPALENFQIVGTNANVLIGGWKALVASGEAPADFKSDVFRKNYERCLGCGYCTLGCRYNRKLSMVETYIPKAIDIGREVGAEVKVIVGCHAKKIEKEQKRVTGVQCRMKDGRQLYIEADRVVVSCGAIGSSVLLMKSRLGNNVGSRFSFNANTAMFARFSKPIDAFNEIQMGSFVDCKDYILESWYNPPFAVSALVPGWFEEHFERMKAYNQYASAGVVIGTAAEGRVKRLGFLRDLLGPVVYEMSCEDLQRIKRGMNQLTQIFFAAGAETVYPTSFTLNLEMKARDFKGRPEAIANFLDEKIKRQADLSLNSAHPQGGNPMSDDPSIGVVDSQFRVHGYDNLFVCDASVFPSTIGINPQLTIMAMADYFCYLPDVWKKQSR